MNPVAFDGVKFLVLDRSIYDKKVKVICAGTGIYDGGVFTIESEGGSSNHLNEDTLAKVAIPLTAHWKKKYPDYEWYIVAVNTLE